jgi:hypothetical protein
LVVSNGHKVTSLASDIRKGLADLEKAERELHDAQKLLRTFKAGGPSRKGKGRKKHAKRTTKASGKKISVSQAIKLARGK